MLDKHNSLNLINQARVRAKMHGFTKFFTQSKKRLVTLGYIAVAILVLWFLLDLYNKSAQEKYSEILHQSLIEEEKGDFAKAQENLQKIYEAKFAPSGVKGLASLRYAAMLLNSGAKDEALKVYLSIADSSRYDQYLRELSGLLAAKLLVISIDSNSDKANKTEALEWIEKFESRSKILHFYFSEQKGILEMKLGNLEKAHQIFTEIIQSSNGEQGLKLRVSDILKLVAAKGFDAKIVEEVAVEKNVGEAKEIEQKAEQATE